MSSNTISIDDAREHGIPLVQLNVENPKKPKRKPTNGSPRLTLADAFDFQQTADGGFLDTQKAIRAVGFLLEYGSANKELESIVASGLAAVLRQIADDVQHYMEPRTRIIGRQP